MFASVIHIIFNFGIYLDELVEITITVCKIELISTNKLNQNYLVDFICKLIIYQFVISFITLIFNLSFYTHIHESDIGSSK